MPGGEGGDVWRDGNRTAPTYAAYAARAWLQNNSPCTIVRLLGSQHRDAITDGEAGWTTAGTLSSTNGGAYGLFLFNSASAAFSAPSTGGQTGSLAAVWYCDRKSVHISLSGTVRGAGADSQTGTSSAGGSAILIENVGATQEFICIVSSSASSSQFNFNFSPTSDMYIRKVFNTNPTLCNTDITNTANQEELWLGESFERAVNDAGISDSANAVHGIIMGLSDGTSTYGDLKGKVLDNESLIDSQTGWFVSQDLKVVTAGVTNTFDVSGSSVTKLFKFHGLNHGEWVQNNLKVSIESITAPTNDFNTYGSFNVLLRRVDDSDNSILSVESYTNCNLNPNSPDYIAKKIGDLKQVWLADERKYRSLGSYQNQSKFIRVEMNSDVDAGATDTRLLPFGVWGPYKFQNVVIASSSITPLANIDHAFLTTVGLITPEKYGGGNHDRVIVTAPGQGATYPWQGTFTFPELALRVNSDDGGTNSQDAYWGYNSGKSESDTNFCESCLDIVRSLPDGVSSFVSSSQTVASWVFTLDDIQGISAQRATYAAGSRRAGSSITALSGGFQEILDAGYDRFTAPFFGGHDGLDIKEKDPFRNELLSGKTQFNSYPYNSIKRAIATISDAEVVEMNVATIPGITNTALTKQLIDVCEARADALAIIDLDGGFVPRHENNDDEATRHSSTAVATTVTNLRNRALNSSYACCYFPWVRIQDDATNATLWSPPSVVALGTFSTVDKNSDPWFAPAGFTRGGLTQGSAGIPVVGVRQALTSKERDKLYAANINPIASFPAEGIVIFGQKTLQVTPSALDRVNVRRLMIFVKKRISFMASRLLFEPNIRTTWKRFTDQVEPFLRDVKVRFGLSEFRVVLDATTTTADLVDRNIMYAKILLKPTRAIEFIAIDFVITNTGASFGD
jgi:hypothetical protein